MKEEFTVVKMEEPDFGCEGLPDGEVPLVTVTLRNKLDEIIALQQKDSLLYQLDIREGDKVWIEDGVIGK